MRGLSNRCQTNPLHISDLSNSLGIQNTKAQSEEGSIKCSEGKVFRRRSWFLEPYRYIQIHSQSSFSYPPAKLTFQRTSTLFRIGNTSGKRVEFPACHVSLPEVSRCCEATGGYPSGSGACRHFGMHAFGSLG